MESYLDLIRKRGSGQERNLPGMLHHKTKARDLVANLGVKVPEEYGVFSTVEDINLDELPDNFVLKPTFASSNIGVVVLKREENGTYFDFMRNKSMTIDEILRMQEDALARFKPASPLWVAEERVVGESGNNIPEDYKFYAFKGRIGLIHSVSRAGQKSAHSYFLGDFTPINDPNDEVVEIVLKNLLEKTVSAPPACAKELIEAAKTISKAIDTPFARIDMYAGKDGPVFGEFTLVPGTFYYEDREKMLPPLSDYMGLLWHQALTD